MRGTPALLKKMKKIVAFGNPLLDTTIFVKDSAIFHKYNLKEDDQKEVTKNEMQSLCNDIASYEQFKSAGGCAQNSLRVMQWLLKKQGDAIIFGSVGKDDDAITLRSLLEKDGVQTRYIEQSNFPTGKTIAVVKPPYRSLVAYIGAAEKLPLSDLLAEKDFCTLVLQSDFVYIEGFFLTERNETAKYILDFCNEHNKVIIYNISGEYICNLYPELVGYFVENVDVVFGNKREFTALANVMNITIEELIKRLSEHELRRKKIGLRGKTIVITDGPRMGTCVYDGKQENFEVPLIEKTDLIDTTGAGDAFTGGFMAGLCTSKSLQDCAKIGCYAAYHIIKQTGCTLPDIIPEII